MPKYEQELIDLVVGAVKAGVPIPYMMKRHQLARSTIRYWLEMSERLHEEHAGYEAIIAGLTNPDTLPPPVIEAPLELEEKSTVLVIPDLHCPFEHPDSLPFLQAVAEKYQTTANVCLGDEIDAHALGRWPKNPDGLSAGAETRAAIEHLRPFYRAFPEMLVCTSNHTIRPWKRAFEDGLPAAFLRSVETVLDAPDGWRWADDWQIDGVRYIHGEGRSGQNAHLAFLRAFKQSVVHGHIHSYGGVATESEYFAMNAGCLIDIEAYAFAYGKKHPIKVSLGCGVVFDGKHALFIRMDTDKDGRWTGKIY